MMLWLILLFVLFAAVFLFLLFPAHASREMRKPFEHRAYAHRGLYSPDQSVPENSLPAFRLAVEAAGAELDVRTARSSSFMTTIWQRRLRSGAAYATFTLEEPQYFRFSEQTNGSRFFDVLKYFMAGSP